MNQKEYELIAGVARTLKFTHSNNYAYQKVLDHYAECLADALEREYKTFDRAKFLKACGIEVDT